MTTKNLLNLLMFCILYLCTSCAEIDTIDLPDLNAKSFSSEQVIQKQKILEKKREDAKKLNQMEKSNESR